MFPYKLQLTLKLKRGDKAKPPAWCRWMLQHPDVLDGLWMSDEAHFFLDGYVSKQNCRYWSEEHPHISVEHEQFPSHVTVWCAVSAKGIIGPHFF